MESSASPKGHCCCSVQSFSCVRLFAIPWTAARQTTLSITNSQSLLKLMSIESVMPSNHLILLHPTISSSHQAPLAMGFSRQEYWSGLPCTSPGDLPDPGIELVSLASPALVGGFASPALAGPELASESEIVSYSVVSSSLQPHELYPPGPSVHGILHARILEWVAIPLSRGSS